VCHQHILWRLAQRGVNPHIVRLISEMYNNITTYIDAKSVRTDLIKILTGVKQGDPMSPMLFNITLDPLLCKLEAEGKGFQQDGSKITAMAFEDDLVLLSNSWAGMNVSIKILETF
ncbi:PO21 protein, partial [Regulus satrapa]|nr:PO21 protein [Regulus satrapa]